ncbi:MULTISPECIES: NAD(P)/FAD-dependent oxidoreductase [unclassified Pseudomonas]|uniref:NAD(P)/FAD-dependent oxidoreductase n=1 Tax=unclassified Pseudomonas TaxID=196821 RepID=UPI001304E5F1|nr:MULTISPECIES: NAD(P)/FAD-dependent oxidoreductase [unclassified Pseudomonas]
MSEMFDVVVVGGGFAGCSAALSLSRSAMAVKVVDAGYQRNRLSNGVYSYLGIDGKSAHAAACDFERELDSYHVPILRNSISSVVLQEDLFSLVTAEGMQIKSRYLILATGVRDVLPALPGLEELWGRSVFNCLYCGAYEYQGRILAVYGSGQAGYEDAIKATSWSKNVILYQSAESVLTVQQLAHLELAGVVIETSSVSQLIAAPQGGVTVFLVAGEARHVDVMFLRSGIIPRLSLASDLGCELDPAGYIQLDRFGRTSCPGLYVCGDATGQLFQAIGAAADGNKVARQLHYDSLFSIR